MAEEYIVAIDVGTTNCKAVLFDVFGNVADQESSPIEVLHNRIGPGWEEIDIDQIWSSVCTVTGRLLSRTARKNDRIACVSLTTLRQSILPIDRNYKPLRYVIPWCIKGTSEETTWVREHIGADEVYRETGLTIDPEWVLPSILYMMGKEKDVYRKTYKILEVQDYVAFLLGAEGFVTDYSQASCLSIFDINRSKWSDAILDTISLPLDMLPDLVPPGELVGEINSSAHESTGIPKGCPIVIAGGDSQCSALGCGVTDVGKANVVVGTSAVAMAYTERPLFDPMKRLVTHPHCYADKYILDHQTLTGGIAYKWYRDVFCRSEIEEAVRKGINPYELINRQIEQVPPGAHATLFLPHFVGAASPFWNEKATGVIVGLNVSSRREDIGRAVIEGIALEVKRGFEIMKALGVKVEEICICGGGCKAGTPWAKIQADVYGIPIKTLCTNETTALGAAILAAKALNMWKSVPDAAEHMIRPECVIEPNCRNSDYYKSLLDLQEKVFRSLESGGVYEEMRRLNKAV